LLGVRAVIAESYERIHRSNLVGMGILPLQFLAEEDADSHGLTGDEVYEITGIKALIENFAGAERHVTVKVCGAEGRCTEFSAIVRIDTPKEALYYRHGGILQYVLRQLLEGKTKPEVVGAGLSTMADPATGSIVT